MTDQRNQYDEYFDQQKPAAPSRAKAIAGKYDQYLDRQDRAAAQVNVLDAPNPDDAARANRYQRTMGVPAALAQDDIKNYDAMARQREVARLAGQLPAFAKFMAHPRNAAVAHDDNNALGTIGNIFQTFSNRPAPAPTAKPKTWTQSLLDAPRNIASSLYAGVGQASQGLVGIAKAAIEVKDQIDPFSWIDYAITGREGRGGMPGSEKTAAEKEANGTAMLDRIIGLQQNEISRSTVGDEGFVGNSIYSGIQSIPSSVAALVNPAAGLGLMGASTGGQNYVQARAAGVSPVNAATYGARQGATEVLTEHLGPSGWIDGLKAGSPFLKRMGQYLYKDVGGELLATTAQNFDQWATIESNQGKTFGDYVKQLPADLAQTAIAAITTGAATTGAVELASKTAERIDHAVTARRSERALAGVMDAAAASKLRKRDPEAFKQFVSTATEGTLTENAYVPVEAIDTLMQTEGFEDQDGFFGALQQQIVDARATGGDVVIPVSDIASKLAGTPAWDALKDDTRLEAGGLSPKEMRVEGDAILKTIQTRGDEIAKAADSEATRAEPARQVFDEVKGQLTGIGRSDREATNLAAVYAARAEAWGERLGVSATDYHAKYPVEFKSDVGTAQAAAPNVMEQQKARDYFTLDAWKEAKASGDRIVYLTPQQFLNAAVQEAPRDTSTDTVENALGDDGQLTSLPELALRTRSDGSVIIDMHDGRHRARALAARGETLIPVRVSGKGDLSAVFAQDGYGDPINMKGATKKDYTNRQTLPPIPKKEATQGGMSDDDILAALFEQNPGNGARGQIALGANGTNVITLFENANLSTLLHETGHQFLEELQRNAADPTAPDSVREDWEKVKAWFAENDVALTGDLIPREAHELWARGFERYAMEGKAPSSALQSAFAAFRGWLLRIYQVVQNLRAPITPEVREVMDRMLATQSAIDEFAAQQNVKAAWTDAKQAGMTDAEFAAYQRSLIEAKDDAYDALLFKTMHRIAQRKKLEYSAEAKAIRAEATQAINEEPRFRALRLLRTGKLGDTAVDGAKLNSEWLVDRFGDDALERLPKGPAIYSKTGIDADELAELTGFSSGAEMVQALFDVASAQAEQRAMGDKRQLRDTLIDNATNAAIEAKGLVDPLTDGSIEEEAIAAISNDRQGEVFATELRHLARRTKSQPTPYRLARDWAKAKIEAGRVKDVASRSALQRYARAAAKSSRAFEEAIVAGNTDEAFRHKQAQMLNHALFVEAKNAADDVDTIVARMNKLGKRAAMKSVDQDYFDRVHDLLERYDFRPRSQRFLAERDRFENWAARRAAEGFEVLTPDRLNVAGQHYSQTTVEELHGLRDAVDSLMSLGRLKQKFLDAKAERDFADVRSAILANLGKLKARVLPDRTFNEDTARKTLRTRIAGGIKISTLALDMDHQDPNGPMMNLLAHRVSDQSLMRDRLRESVLAPIAQSLGKMSRAKWKRLDELVTVPEISFNRGLGQNDPRLGQPITVKRRDLLAIALNTGNASNFDKMTKGEGWNQETVRAVLDRELNADDWKLVQQMWDSVGSLWPHIVHTERQLSGVVPEKVDSTPITNRHGTFDGGYWPVVYDPERSAIGEANEIKSADDMFGRGSGLGTPKGHTITRTEANGPMVYSLEHVLFKHVEQVITRLSFAEYARDVMRVLKDDAIRGEIDLKLGKEYRQEIPLWLQDLILPVNDGKAGDWADSLLRFSRQGIVAVGMGLRFGTGVAQISGLASSIARLGGKQTHKLLYHVSKQVLAGVGNMARGQRSEIHEFVFERSEMMARRLRENTVEVEKASRKLRGKHTWRDAITPWQFWHIGMVDLHVVSIPTWITGYRDAISRGMTEEQAAKYGDQMVGTSQGSGRQEHLARWQRSQSEAKKIFYMFYTPFNVIFNAQWEAARGVKRGDYTRAANLTFFMLMAQTLVDAALSGDWPGGGDDDDDESAIRQWAEWAGRNVFFGLFSGVPIVRDAAAFGERAITGQYATFGGTPTGRIFEEMGRSASDLYKVQQDEKDFEPNMVPGLANSAGMALHLPLGQPGQTTKFLWQYKRDEVHPQSIGDWYTGLTKGKIAEKKE